jgi:hypothetical protein
MGRGRYGGDVERLEMVPVALAASGFEAKVLAARLGADGVVWELRGDVDSVYPVGGIEVLVPREELDQARELLAAPLPDEGAGTTPPADGVVRVSARQTHHRLVVAGAAGFVLLFVTVRLLAMG